MKFFDSLVDCPPGMEYQMCGLNIHCDDLRVVRDCRNSTCDSGCFCSNGTVLEDGVCVHPNTCPSKDLPHHANCTLVHKNELQTDMAQVVQDTTASFIEELYNRYAVHVTILSLKFTMISTVL